MDPAAAITLLTNAMRPRDDIRALFLSGSYGAGTPDDFSDLDFQIVSPDGPTDTIAQAWVNAVTDIGQIVLLRDRVVSPALINTVAANWLRIDVLILTPEQVKHHPQDRLHVLFDHDDVFAQLPKTSKRPTPSARRIMYVIEDFMRIFGLLPVALGRADYNIGVTGLFHLRNLLIELMIAQADKGQVGGTLHLKKSLSFDQQTDLAQLPVPIPEHDALIEVHMAYADVFLTRAKRVAAKHDLDWPDALEAAMWARLGNTLGITKLG